MYGDWKGIVRENCGLLAAMMFIEVLGGGVLNSMEALFSVFPAILSFVPVINAIGGNIGSVMGARLSSSLHLGTVRPALSDPKIREDMETSVLIGILAIFISAISLYAILPMMGVRVSMEPVKWIGIVAISAVTMISTVLPAAVMATIWSFKKGRSPDDFTIPVVSTLGDFMGIISILIAVKMVGL